MYYAVFALGIILAAVNDKKKVSFKIFVAVLLLFAFLRYGVGADYFSYQYLFNRLNPSIIGELTSGVDNQEIGFRLIGSLFKGIGLSYQFYVIIIAIVNIGFIAKTCSKHSINPTLSLLLYFCFYYLVWTFSGLRQGLTLAIGVYYLLEYIERKIYFKFFIIIALLMTIHASAIILVPLFFASRINFTRKSLIILSLSSLVFAIIPWGYILSNLSWIPLVQRVLTYMDTTALSFSSIFDFQSVGRLIFLVIIFFYYKSYAEQSNFSRKLLNIYIISIVLYFVFKFSELTAARLSIYGKILDIILLSNFYYLYKEKINKILYALILFVLMILYLNKEMVSLKEQSGLIYNSDIYTPYTHILDPYQFEFDNVYVEKTG